MLANPGGWYANLTEAFKSMLKVVAPTWGEDLIIELAAMYGLWRDLSAVLKLPGVSAFFTGAADTC